MKQHRALELSHDLTKKFGLSFHGSVQDGSVTITAGGIPKNNGFSIIITQSWKRLSLDFVPGTYAKALISGMEKAELYERQTFAALADEIESSGGMLSFRINGSDINIDDLSLWPERWTALTLSLKTRPLDFLGEDEERDFQETAKWAELFVACVLTLVPLEDVEDLNLDQHGLPEGAATKVTVNKYERNRVNRAICLHFHGTACSVCNMDFSRLYGEVGAGFIHVHHIVPVSVMKPDYCFDPRKDLIPVCPNCHAMLHRREPPYSVGELKGILANAKAS